MQQAIIRSGVSGITGGFNQSLYIFDESQSHMKLLLRESTLVCETLNIKEMQIRENARLQTRRVPRESGKRKQRESLLPRGEDTISTVKNYIAFFTSEGTQRGA